MPQASTQDPTSDKSQGGSGPPPPLWIRACVNPPYGYVTQSYGYAYKRHTHTIIAIDEKRPCTTSRNRLTAAFYMWYSLWNAKLTETQIFRELSIEIESSLFN